jgi:Glycosyl hydrolase family 95 catalytic domain/Glycoside hydrolase family 95, C-terminal domain
LRMWGSQYWWNNQGTYFNGLTPANRPELMAPVFATYSRNYDSFARAARQQWGSQGIWIPETTWFDGLEDLPDNIAAEMRDLYLARKPWSERSKAFDDYARDKNGLNSRWNWNFLANKQGPFAWTSHIMSTTAKISYLYWLHYAYSLDTNWLRTTGYPMIKGTAEFYRNFPNLYKAADGKYHIRYVNNLESHWGGTDAPEELLAMYEMFPIAIRASEILGVDAELRPRWKEILDNLTPIPASALEPGEYYDLCNVGTEDKTLFENVLAAYKNQYTNGVNEKTTVRVLSRTPVVAANLGLADDVKFLIPAQIRSVKEDNCDIPGSGESGLGVLRNRLMLREGPGAIECERLGVASHALQSALLQSDPPTPDGEPVNYIFPAWPKEWDAQFKLAARDAFVISASMGKGQIEFVEIHSQKGGPCRVENPWPGDEITLYRNGKAAENISGKLLEFSTAAGETVTLASKGKPLVKEEAF